MLQITLFEIIARGIPEGLIFIFAAYVYANKKLELNKYIISAIVQAVAIYFIRLLPVSSAVIFILNLMVIIFVLAFINNFDIIKSIKVSIITMICQFICEGLNVFFIQNVLKKDLNYVFNDPILKTIYSSPSLILFAIIVMGYYIIKKKRVEYISNGKVDQ